MYAHNHAGADFGWLRIMLLAILQLAIGCSAALHLCAYFLNPWHPAVTYIFGLPIGWLLWQCLGSTA